NGSASKISCNCYVLTDSVDLESGSVWNSKKIDLGNSFDFNFNVFAGCIDSLGADGIAFILQPLSTSIGANGQGLGFAGVAPSVGIALDTWRNPNLHDPAYDHVSIQINGDIDHLHDLAGPVPASATSDNIEDCNWHTFRIQWDAGTKRLTAYFDGQFRVQAQYDLVANVFGGDPMVYWGFSGATGSGHNIQRFCTALNPLFSTGLPDSATCIGKPVNFTDLSQSFTQVQTYNWTFGDGTSSHLQNPPPHTFPAAGAYTVSHSITGMDGCVSDAVKKTVTIGAKPVADFSLFNTCTEKTIGINDFSKSSFGPVARWSWMLDGSASSTDAGPQFRNLAVGTHELDLAVATVYGCKSDTLKKTFTVKSSPVVAVDPVAACWQTPVALRYRQLDNATTITQWNWAFDNGSFTGGQSPSHSFESGGNHVVHLTVIADNGCISNDTTAVFSIEDVYPDAGKDTAVQSHIPFTINGTVTGNFNSSATYAWTPSFGINSTAGPSMTATLLNDQKYVLTATTGMGCVGRDTVKVRVFDFPGVLVPSGFTPNHDGLNDVLRPRYDGIRHLDYFAVYNRWGRLVFRTSDMQAGWDGTVNGKVQDPATFVWIISAEGYSGKRYQLRGTSTIVR
ncbi:MAG TPA: PKD domain-containing protein, partial [Chitinophagaceae bacterium]